MKMFFVALSLIVDSIADFGKARGNEEACSTNNLKLEENTGDCCVYDGPATCEDVFTGAADLAGETVAGFTLTIDGAAVYVPLVVVTNAGTTPVETPTPVDATDYSALEDAFAYALGKYEVCPYAKFEEGSSSGYLDIVHRGAYAMASYTLGDGTVVNVTARNCDLVVYCPWTITLEDGTIGPLTDQDGNSETLANEPYAVATDIAQLTTDLTTAMAALNGGTAQNGITVVSSTTVTGFDIQIDAIAGRHLGLGGTNMVMGTCYEVFE